MLGKLLKYEFRATGRTMLPLFGLLLLVSGLTNLAMRAMDGNEDLPDIVKGICILISVLFFVGLLAVGMVTVFAMAQRFRGSLLRNEGYIMLTLPVSIHAHIWAKAIVAGVWYALSAVVSVLATLIMAADVEMIKSMGELVGELTRVLGDIRNMEILIELLAVLVLACVFVSMLIYASLALGHSFGRNKMLLSFAFGVALTVAMEIFFSGAGRLIEEAGVYDLVPGGFTMAGWRVMMAVGAGNLILGSAILYGITVWVMKRRLNLE